MFASFFWCFHVFPKYFRLYTLLSFISICICMDSFWYTWQPTKKRDHGFCTKKVNQPFMIDWFYWFYIFAVGRSQVVKTLPFRCPSMKRALPPWLQREYHLIVGQGHHITFRVHPPVAKAKIFGPQKKFTWLFQRAIFSWGDSEDHSIGVFLHVGH